MNIPEIKELMSAWDKWSFDPVDREIVCFTAQCIDFDEDREEWIVTFKPKTWIKCSPEDAKTILEDESMRKNFTFEHTIFTEKEKAEPTEFNQLFD